MLLEHCRYVENTGGGLGGCQTHLDSKEKNVKDVEWTGTKEWKI